MRLLASLLILISLIHGAVKAQDSTQQTGIIDENNKNSSSFVADPDPLDPLPVKKENIKEGDEIILDDIRQVIDRPSSSSSSSKSAVKKSSRASKDRQSKSKKNRRSRLKSDGPDARLESQLHRNYLKYDVSPTSVELWSKATQVQKENIYIVQKQDNLFTISKTLFGDSKFWPKIWALNRSSILNPHQITPGMKIYFFAGDESNAPTLSFNSIQSESESEPYNEKDQKTEFGTTKISKSVRKNLNYPVPIPDSLPETQNSRLYTDENTDLQVQLRSTQYIETPVYTNPYFLSSTELRTDFVVPDEQIPYLICKDNQFVPLVTKKDTSSPPAEKYLLISALIKNKDALQSTYKYKVIGDVTINSSNQMRVSSCKQLMNVDTLIVPEEKVKALNEPREDFAFAPRIVDSLEDYRAQEYYTDNQYLIINMNGLNVDNGAELNIYSDVLGKKVGRIRILQRSGTVAIAIVTNTYDIITKGDKVLE